MGVLVAIGVLSVGERELRHVRILEAMTLVVEVLIVGLVEVGTSHDVQVMSIVEGLVVVEVTVEHLVLINAVVGLEPVACGTTVRWSSRCQAPSVVEVRNETHVAILSVLADEGVVAIECQTMSEVNLQEASETQVVHVTHALTTLLAVTNHGAGVILLTVVGVHEVTIRAKERAPAPQVLITSHGIVLAVRHTVIGAVDIRDAGTNGQPVGSLNRQVGGCIVAAHLVGVEVLQALTLVVAKRYIVVSAASVASNRDVVALGRSSVVEHDATHVPVSIVAILVVVVAVDHLAISGAGVAMLLNPVVDTILELLAIHVHTKQLGGVTLAIVVIDKGLNLSGYVRILGQCGCLAP